jgi:ferredoxin
MVVDSGCMKCMDCVSVCPNDALYFGMTQKSGSQSNVRLPAGDRPLGGRRIYDFTLLEELFGLLVVFFAVYALRGLYDIAPLLLSVAVGVMTAYLAIQCLRVFRKRDQRIQHLQMKRNGQVTRSGLAMIVFHGLWMAFLVHSCVVQYYRYQGRASLGQVSATWDELLSGTAQQRLTQSDLDHIDKALLSYQLTDQIGMLDVLEVKLGQAIGNLMLGNRETAEAFLRQAYLCDRVSVGDMLREFLVAQDRQTEAAEIR